jgi:hypothetical protein
MPELIGASSNNLIIIKLIDKGTDLRYAGQFLLAGYRFCGEGGSRTRDTRLMSPLLYH